MAPDLINKLPALPPRPTDGHKGDFGKVLIIAGSRSMPGAAALTANSALRSGAGLVRIASTCSAQPIIAALAPCATHAILPEDAHGQLAPTALPLLLEQLTEHDAVALGPGLGRSNAIKQLLATLLPRISTPLVVDADGLNNLAALPLPSQTILTPHPGEFARLWKALRREPIPDDRSEQAARLAEQTGATIVLKGAGTVVAGASRVYVNNTGNPGMATAGSGDVLTGCILALLGAGLAPFDAAALGVHVHGAAGDCAAVTKSRTSLIATDIIEALPPVFGDLENRR